MRENGLNARGRRKFIPTTDSNRGLPVCGNLLNRKFYAEKDGEKGVSDSTYLRTLGGWVYLTVILDLYDRKVIGWALSADMETVHTTIPALETAVANRKAREGLLFHSDRGVQYCAKSFRERLNELCPSVRRSMSRKGNCSGLRLCRIVFQDPEKGTGNGGWQTPYRGGKEFGVHVCPGVYYNRIRLHSALDYVAPDVFDSGQAA
jgi:transposase InsO family protein